MLLPFIHPCCTIISNQFALVAQWIRALACGVRGRVFESRRGCSKRSGKSRPVSLSAIFQQNLSRLISRQSPSPLSGKKEHSQTVWYQPLRIAVFHSTGPETNQSLLDDTKKVLSPEEIYLAEELISTVILVPLPLPVPTGCKIKTVFRETSNHLTSVTSLLEMCCIFHNWKILILISKERIYV